MREIKFQAWDTYLHRILSWDEICGLISDEELSIKELFAGERYIPVQFIGLMDKNGKEIYEGDILNDYTGNHMQTIFLNGALRFFRSFEGGMCMPVCFDYYCSVVYEGPSISPGSNAYEEHKKKYTPVIIGNIYENPCLELYNKWSERWSMV